MIDAPNIDAAVRRELLRLALLNSARSIPLQLLAVGIIVALALFVGAQVGAAAAAALGLSVAAWRFRLSRRFAHGDALDEGGLASATWQLEGNAALAGLLWAVCSFAIYPHLHDTMATTYVVIAIGSIATAALFMSLVGRSFLYLVLLSLGSLVAVSLLVESVRSLPVAALVGVLGLTMIRAANESRETTLRAIRHSLEADHANESLLQAKQAADAANLAKSQFLAMMSHEIRTPMNGVLGAIELLRHTRLDANQRRLARTAASSGESLMNILNDVLDHSKIEAGRLELLRGPFSVHATAGAVVSLFQANAESKQLALRLEVEPQVADWVLGDAQRLKQVLLNLVGNAIKFTERGSVRLRLTATSAPPGWAGIGFEVRDTGVGLSPEARAGLFKPFQQLGVDRRQRRGGTGLGLAISQRIVQAMGGQIEVQSEAGKGTSFRFGLRLERDKAPTHHAVPADSSLADLDSDSQLSGLVLVAEDNDVSRMIACEMLTSLGLDTVDASDGAQVLKLLTKYPVDLVLMDGHMPGMDGYTATQEIRRLEKEQRRPRLPILALTADAFDEDIARTRSAGMDGHMAKPYTRDQLKALLSQWL
ncbi:MAG: ATP-binding protein [Rhizobacter sp.]|nr:ATP-binding protein [Rhizobacter sp.]